MTERPIVAWAAVARGEAIFEATFNHIISGSTRSAEAAAAEAERAFKAKWPTARYLGVTTLEIREGD